MEKQEVSTEGLTPGGAAEQEKTEEEKKKEEDEEEIEVEYYEEEEEEVLIFYSLGMYHIQMNSMVVSTGYETPIFFGKSYLLEKLLQTL